MPASCSAAAGSGETHCAPFTGSGLSAGSKHSLQSLGLGLPAHNELQVLQRLDTQPHTRLHPDPGTLLPETLNPETLDPGRPKAQVGRGARNARGMVLQERALHGLIVHAQWPPAQPQQLES